VQVGSGGGFPLLFLGPAVKRKGQRNEEEEGTVGVKRAGYPTPIFIPKRSGSWGSWAVFHYPDRFHSKLPSGGTERGGGFCNRAPGS
jgi:hypothetical protein